MSEVKDLIAVINPIKVMDAPISSANNVRVGDIIPPIISAEKANKQITMRSLLDSHLEIGMPPYFSFRSISFLCNYERSTSLAPFLE
jgi:hypothetical protein